MTVKNPDVRPVRILLLESGRGPGGSVNFIRDFVLYLDHARVQVISGLYCFNPSRTLEEIRRLGFRVVFFRQSLPGPSGTSKPGSSLFDTKLKRLRKVRSAARVFSYLAFVQLPLAWQISRFLKKEAVDIVVLNQDVHFHVPGVLAAKLAGVPCVCRKAGGIGEARRLKRYLTPCVDLFVSISKATEDDQRNTPGTKNLLNIYEGVDLARFASLPAKAGMREKLGVRGNQKVVAAITRFEPGKGLPEFIQMAAKVVRRYPDAAFLIVGGEGPGGDGRLTAELKSLIHSLGLDEQVILAGWWEDIPSVMAAVDIFVHCPTTFIEGLARTCLEAMAVGIPSVVSDNGGMPDAVINGVTGFVVPPGEIDGMAEAVLKLLEDEGLAAAFGAGARLRIEQVFDMAQNARKLQQVLLEYARRSGVMRIGSEQIAGGH